MRRTSAMRFYFPLVVTLLALLAIEVTFLPMPGIQEDEALFLVPFLHGHPQLYSWTVANVRVPLMLTDYIGALKTWIYWPVFRIWQPSIWSIRLPACFFSLLTVWILAEFLKRAVGTGVALITALLLATDSSFVLTNVFDWGPVSLLLLSTVLFLHLFRLFPNNGKRFVLGAAFLVAGIATWYKTLFLVLLAAMALSCLLVFWGRLRERMQPSNIVVAVLSFAIGAMPLITYNLQRSGATVNMAGHLPAAKTSEKLMMLQHTLDGRALEHYMFRSFPGENIALHGAPLDDLVSHWYERSSFHPAGLLFPALILALITLPFLRNSAFFSPLLFAWIAFAAVETAMQCFRNAGAGPHHTVLVYPAPQFIVAASTWAFMERVRRPMAVWAIAFGIVAGNLWLLRSYYDAGKHNGFSVFWTDSIGTLGGIVVAAHLPVAVLDWGIQKGLQVQTHNQVEIVEPSPIRPGVLYVSHCEGYILDEARSKPYVPSLRQTRIVTDRLGVPLFCLLESSSPTTVSAP